MINDKSRIFWAAFSSILASCLVATFALQAHADDIFKIEKLPPTKPMTHEEVAAQLLQSMAPIFREVAEMKKSGAIKTDKDVDQFLAGKVIDDKTLNADQILFNETYREVEKLIAEIRKNDPNRANKPDRALDIARLKTTVDLDAVAIRMSLSKGISPGDLYEAQRLMITHDLLAGRFPSKAQLDSDGAYARVHDLLFEKLAEFEQPAPVVAKIEGEKREAAPKADSEANTVPVTRATKPGGVAAAQ